MIESALRPITIGARIAKNRVVVSAHSSGLMCADGNSDKLHAYVESRAHGGVGIFLLGETLVHDGAERAGEAWGLAVSWAGIEGVYRRLSQSARKHEMLLIDQLSHLGGQVWSTHGAMAFAPSSIAHDISGVVPAPLDRAQIHRIERAYVQAAQRAADGGLDGVEIKCDQGKLLHQFLSSRFNRRTDEFGNGLAARIAFPLRVANAVREAVPKDFIVGVRLSLKGYDTVDEAEETTAGFIEASNFDYVSLSADTNSSYTGYVAGHCSQDAPRPTLETAVTIVRRSTAAPVMIAGKVQTLEEAAAVIAAGGADLIAMTRAHIADPDIVRKAMAGDSERIRPCIACNQSCVGNTWEGREVRCIHNVAAGRELDLSDRSVGKAVKPLRVGIIGGGPAGLEAARISGLRGHMVSLFEAGPSLGGQLLSAKLRPGSSRLGDVVTYLEAEVRRLPNIAVHLETEITSFAGAELHGVDQIFVATGSLASKPKSEHGTWILSAEDALMSGCLRKGDRVLVADDDWIQNGLGIAIALLQRGLLPEIITTREAVGAGLNVVTLVSQLGMLRSHGVPMLPLMAFSGVSPDGTCRVLDLCTGREEQRCRYSAVVLVRNRQPNRLEFFARENVSVTAMGDCVFPRGLEYAILDGNRSARRERNER